MSSTRKKPADTAVQSRRRTVHTEELVELLLKQQRETNARLAAIETNVTLLKAALDRHARALDTLNQRCAERLGLKCPMDADDEDDAPELGEPESVPA